MNNLTFTGTILAAILLLTACDPQPARNKPSRGNPNTREPGAAVEGTELKTPKIETPKPPTNEIEEPAPVVERTTKPVPPPVPNPEYGKKSEGKPGFIESPYAPGKLIDVRGLPPGTEIECPYTRRPLLVP